MTAYARFKLKIEPSKIVSGWDLSLRAVVRHRTSEKVAGDQHNWRNWGQDGLAINGFGRGPMDMVLEEENDVVALVEGKRRQRVVEKLLNFLGSKESSSSMHLSTSSGRDGKLGARVTKLRLFSLRPSGVWKAYLRKGFEDGGRIHLVVYRASLRELVTKCKSRMIRPNWTTVNQLINTETSTWDRDLVYYLVDESTADRIFAIPISESGQEDRLVWKHEGSGEYSVKSGYWALNTDYLRDSTYRSSFGEDYKEVLGFIRGYVHNICLNFMSPCSPPRPLIKEIWRPPDPGVIKLNFDASFLKEEKLAVTAILARNFTGEIVGAETYLFNDVADAFVAEARACERALIFAGRMCFRRLVVEGDLLTEISYLAVTRLINEAAHTLALEGRRRKIYGDWLTGVPESVRLAAL
ncbi:hypothetical protein GOBAR_DD14660 [Gossypium barbadense]|nr:hypothetical protein GOBAR_DD14660 [Gossypium barbadense]